MLAYLSETVTMFANAEKLYDLDVFNRDLMVRSSGLRFLLF